MISALVLILAVAALGLLLTLQGWRSRPPAFDMLTYFNSAENLIKRGVLPAYGDLSSYGSFSPPGAAWLLAPGLLVFDDPRLFEKLGGAALHMGTLLGVFLVARDTFGMRCAYLSVVIYGLSGLGLSFAGSLWPIGHPFFYVWMVYLTNRWITQDEPGSLAAAIMTFTVGMYYDMAITPAIFILPVAWFVYRPRVIGWMLVVASLATLAVWYPYLHFQVDRHFADLRSQFLLRNIFPANYRDAWCDPHLTLNTYAGTTTPDSDSSASQEAQDKVSPGGAPPLFTRLLARVSAFKYGLLATMHEVAPTPAISLILLLALLGSIAALSLSSTPILISTIPGRRAPAWVITAVNQLLASINRRKLGVLLLGLLIPWVILLAVAEPDRPERFYWLWPLQAVFMAAFFMSVLPSLRVPTPVLGLGLVMLVAVIVVHPLQSQFGPWLREGWAGSDPPEVQVVDYVADQLKPAGKDHAAIGYQTFIYEFMPNYHIIDPQYKVGAEFDLLFKYRHGITNADRCAEGLSPADEFRIVQAQPRSGDGEPTHYFDAPTGERFRLLRHFGLYDVFKRD